MDARRLVEVGLTGSAEGEQYAILLVRVAIGLFFAISGGNKLFTADGRKTVYETLATAKIPAPGPMGYFISAVELVGGCMIAAGLLCGAACVALFVDMVAAIWTTSLRGLPKGAPFLLWLDDFLYLPEVLYVLFFVWLICSGPGRFSVDHWLAARL